jgi:chorismate mutase / prephenate dehydratase
MSDDELAGLRAEIDRLDDEILRRLNERAAAAQNIGRLKDGTAYRPEREAQVLRRVKESNAGPLPGETVARIFREIMSACLALEKPLRVTYLGPRGTFSEAAALKHFGHGANTVPCGSIDEVFRSVESRSADYGVVPVENSTEGAIGRSLDLMTQSPLKACGEIVLRVHHYLLSKDGSMHIGAVRNVYSHAQSLAQCHEWLNLNLPGARRTPVASNAEAACLAAREPDSVAIAGETAAEYYALHVLARNIEDEPNNTTRFLVLGDHDVGPSGRDKTSLVMSAKNRPGAVHELLTPFAAHQVSMTKFESRPSRTELWEYVFFVDVEGHMQDEKVARSLAEVREKATFVKVIGSYPAAVI